MKKIIFLLICSPFLFINCQKDKNPFLISKDNIGLLNNTVQIHQLDSVYTQDSIVSRVAGNAYSSGKSDIEIYEKGGEKLLVISPKLYNDSTSVVSNIQVFDSRFVTEKGLNLKSTFKDIKDHYTIASIENTLSSVIIFIEGTDIYIAIDKKHLPESLRYDLRAKVEITQIPDEAPFKYFMIGWYDHNQ